MAKERIKDLLDSGAADTEVTVEGWLRTVRHSKNVSFLDISDGSCMAGIQAVAAPGLDNYETEIGKLTTGCCVRVAGRLVESPGKGQSYEIQAGRVEVVGYADEDYPLQKKRHSFEFLRTLGHLRMRTNTFGAVMRVRNAAALAIHRFFQERGFIHLHAPIITLSDCEGAGEMFRVSALDPDQAPRTESGGVDYSQDFFGKEARLTVSGQLEAEIAALALTNVYTFGPTFRSENSNTSRHLAEFWMVEPEMAFCDIQGNMDLAEAFLKGVTRDVLEQCDDDMGFFNQRIDDTVLETLTNIVEQPFERMTYTEAVNILQGSGRTFEYPVSWGVNLQSEHERLHRGGARRAAGDGHRLPQGDQGVLHVPERRRTDRGGHGRAGAQDRRDHRRLPAGAPAGAAPAADPGMRPPGRGILVVPGATALRHRAPRRLRPGLRAPGPVHDRPREHPRRHPLPPGPRLRGVLTAVSRPWSAGRLPSPRPLPERGSRISCVIPEGGQQIAPPLPLGEGRGEGPPGEGRHLRGPTALGMLGAFHRNPNLEAPG